ncbi:hypothetical protein E2C01_048919 [Portunus trituberculatus]|uniref:Uncharacterized protein n=1 Tax=Portunus trituberculatus TaxID=210409 RepID=A0A5B7GCU0_PORTR|nr:hypothetical protein [Portunus trituberculatus]
MEGHTGQGAGAREGRGGTQGSWGGQRSSRGQHITPGRESLQDVEGRDHLDGTKGHARSFEALMSSFGTRRPLFSFVPYVLTVPFQPLILASSTL